MRPEDGNFCSSKKLLNFAPFFGSCFWVQDHSGAICRGEDDNELQPGKFFSDGIPGFESKQMTFSA